MGSVCLKLWNSSYITAANWATSSPSKIPRFSSTVVASRIQILCQLFILSSQHVMILDWPASLHVFSTTQAHLSILLILSDWKISRWIRTTREVVANCYAKLHESFNFLKQRRQSNPKMRSKLVGCWTLRVNHELCKSARSALSAEHSSTTFRAS